MLSDENIERLLDALFTNGQGDEATWLVLTSQEGRDLGGWCRKAVRDQIVTHLGSEPGTEPKDPTEAT